MKRYALLVGINNYYTLGKLSYAKEDAEAYKEQLCTTYGFSPQEIHLMTCESKQASIALSSYVEAALTHITQKPDIDLLLFGFWGHGYHAQNGQMYLCGMDTSKEMIERTAISLGVVKEKLIQAGAKDTLVVLDCCRDGGGRSTEGMAFAKGDAIELTQFARDLREVSRRGKKREIPTVIVINSCQVGQKAYEWEEKRHGIFTAHLLEEMRKGEKSVSRMIYNIGDRVTETAEKLFHESQSPFSIIEGRGDIELIIQEEKAKEGSFSEEETFRMCPECGFYNRIDKTFKCRECGRKYLCHSHYDAEAKMCVPCSEKTQKHKSKKEIRSIDLTYVEGGTFTMGSTEGHEDEQPLHTVTVDSVYMSIYEITQDIYEEVMRSNPSKWQGARLPVEQVTWFDAVRFCNALSCRDRLEEVYAIEGNTVSCDWSKRGYRLPTEAEWEYAARGGNQSQGYTYAGSNTARDVAWYDDNSGDKTHPVGTKNPNELGLYDMSGNVWEWCWDWYDFSYYREMEKNNPIGPTEGTYTSKRVIRGGSWNDYTSRSRITRRDEHDPLFCRPYGGFRVVLSYGKKSNFFIERKIPASIGYRVGDRGPSGGYIFYDKGTYSNGWRYLEAAPEQTECENIQWFRYESRVGDTEETIGEGRNNTKKIVSTLGEGTYAAEQCANLVVTKDGTEYHDWFLPSKDELHEMYEHLKLHNLGNFGNWEYWSSTEVGNSVVWGQDFNNGSSWPYNKDWHFRVRAIRAF